MFTTKQIVFLQYMNTNKNDGHILCHIYMDIYYEYKNPSFLIYLIDGSLEIGAEVVIRETTRVVTSADVDVALLPDQDLLAKSLGCFPAVNVDCEL